jgi:hypothetical protein
VLISLGLAKRRDNQSCFNIFYPPFNLLEASLIYPSFSERIFMRDKNINFDEFEEKHIIRENVDVEMRLSQIIEDPQFASIKKIFDSMRT